MKGQLRLYGVGGTGINITSYFNKAKADAHSAEIHTAYIDTSKSNMKSDFDSENVSTLENLDGSGKLRKENSDVISDNIKDILLKHPPMDFNVVVFSASGGTGSVAGPLIVKELLSKDIPVVACVVGSEESLITINNTMNTLKTLEHIAGRTNRPVVARFVHMNKDVTRSQVDADIQKTIGCLAIMASRTIAELDSMDIKNWLFYNREGVTAAPATLTALEIYTDTNDWQLVAPISVLGVCESPESSSIPIIPEYQCAGYVQLDEQEYGGIKNIFFITDAELIRKDAAGVDKILKELIAVRDSRKTVSSLVRESDSVDDSGLIL